MRAYHLASWEDSSVTKCLDQGGERGNAGTESEIENFIRNLKIPRSHFVLCKRFVDPKYCLRSILDCIRLNSFYQKEPSSDLLYAHLESKERESIVVQATSPLMAIAGLMPVFVSTCSLLR